MFRDFRTIGIQPNVFVPLSVVVDKPKDTDISNAIHALDDNNVPRSALGALQSKETSPEVAAYIRNNLMQVYDKSEQLPENMRDDDAIIGAMPYRGETYNDYEKRIMDMLENEKSERKRKANEKRLKDAFNRIGISAD